MTLNIYVLDIDPAQAARDLWAPLAASAPKDSKIKAELDANIARIDAMLAGSDPASR